MADEKGKGKGGKQEEAAAPPEVAGGQGNKVTLPNGVARVDFIRDNYFGKTREYTKPELKGNRGAIRKAINEMLVEAKRESEQIPYQIVYAATKKGSVHPEDAKQPAAAAGEAAS